MNRITATTANRRMLEDLNRANRRMVDAQARLSSQKAINKASDDPSRALVALEYRSTLRRSEQYQRNASDAGSWMVAADTALTSSVEELNHVRTLVVQARSGSSDPNALKAIAAEVLTVRDSVMALANTKHLGRPIFVGTADAANAFDSSGAYQGDENSVMRSIAPGITIQVNTTGTEVFGATDADPMSGNVFQVLQALATAIETGDQAAMTDGIDAIDGAVDRLESAQVEVGAKTRQIDDVTSRLQVSDIDSRQALAEVEDVDVAQAMIDVSAKQFAYQAALSSSAQVMQISLLDFLR